MGQEGFCWLGQGMDQTCGGRADRAAGPVPGLS